MIANIKNIYLRRLLVILATIPALPIFLLVCILDLTVTVVGGVLLALKWEARLQLRDIKSCLGCIRFAWAKRGEA